MSEVRIGASIKHLSFFMPEQVVTNNQPVINKSEPWFVAPATRHFAYPKYTAAMLGAKVVEKLLLESNTSNQDIDLLLYSCALNDRAKVGIGPKVRELAKLNNTRIMQVDTGCTSYLSLLKVADALLAHGPYQKAILLTVTDFISRLSDFQQNPKSAVLGDGASATLVERGPSSIISSYEKVYGENFGLMVCEPKKISDDKKSFSVECPGPLQIEFSRRMLRKLRTDSIDYVVDTVESCIKLAQINKNQIDFFLCHQPNRGLIEEWRTKLGFAKPHVYDTFDIFGNLFQSSIPITLAHGLSNNIITKNSTIAAGTFSNGADFTCAMIFRI